MEWVDRNVSAAELMEWQLIAHKHTKWFFNIAL